MHDNQSVQTGKIIYLVGDATQPVVGDEAIIMPHICNSIGGWGAGYVLSISKRWDKPEEEYRKWYRGRNENDFNLGAVQFVQVESNIWIANMIAQLNIKKPKSNHTPIRYDALEQCLAKVQKKAKDLSAAVRMPRIGCGLAGGDWAQIEPIIIKELCNEGIVVSVYDLE